MLGERAVLSDTGRVAAGVCDRRCVQGRADAATFDLRFAAERDLLWCGQRECPQRRISGQSQVVEQSSKACAGAACLSRKGVWEAAHSLRTKSTKKVRACEEIS